MRGLVLAVGAGAAVCLVEATSGHRPGAAIEEDFTRRVEGQEVTGDVRVRAISRGHLEPKGLEVVPQRLWSFRPRL